MVTTVARCIYKKTSKLKKIYIYISSTYKMLCGCSLARFWKINRKISSMINFIQQNISLKDKTNWQYQHCLWNGVKQLWKYSLLIISTRICHAYTVISHAPPPPLFLVFVSSERSSYSRTPLIKCYTLTKELLWNKAHCHVTRIYLNTQWAAIVKAEAWL